MIFIDYRRRFFLKYLIILQVIQEVGLCICLFDILSASEEIVHYGNGASYAKGIRINTHVLSY